MFGLEIFRVTASLLLLAGFTNADIDTFQCHELYEYDASKVGTVLSPFYGARDFYHNGLWCEYRITAPEHYRIKLTFKDFDIAPSNGCFQDYLTVFSKNKLEVIAHICGRQIPNPVLSYENEIRLLFRSDYMVSGRGFLLEYEASPYFTTVCEKGFTQCKNRNCFRNDKKCDGVDDCGDGTDEEDCGIPIENFPEKCGIQQILPNLNESPDRMVGGDETVPNSWPWQVSVQSSNAEPNGHFCGGTIVNAQWIVTATHCIAGRRFPEFVKVHFGAHSLYDKSKYEQVRFAKRIIAYPGLEGDDIRTFTFLHDVTLIKLNAPLTFNKGVQPACLPSSDWKVEPGEVCIATGWGETRGSGFSGWLKQTALTVQSQTSCNRGFDEKTQICVRNRWQNPCHGDSGGPLSCKRNGKWYVFGATSTSTTDNFQGQGVCAGEEQMTIYANLAHKAEWIRETINKNS